MPPTQKYAIVRDIAFQDDDIIYTTKYLQGVEIVQCELSDTLNKQEINLPTPTWASDKTEATVFIPDFMDKGRQGFQGG